MWTFHKRSYKMIYKVKGGIKAREDCWLKQGNNVQNHKNGQTKTQNMKLENHRKSKENM